VSFSTICVIDKIYFRKDFIVYIDYLKTFVKITCCIKVVDIVLLHLNKHQTRTAIIYMHNVRYNYLTDLCSRYQQDKSFI